MFSVTLHSSLVGIYMLLGICRGSSMFSFADLPDDVRMC